jgi:hypothetical protein
MSNKEFKAKKERLIKINVDFSFILKLLLYLLVLIGIYYILYMKYIYIYIVKDQSINEGYLFTILNSIMFLLFMVSCGFSFEIKEPKYKVFIFLLILYLIYYGFTKIGFGFEFRKNFGLLEYITYESNTHKGILFYIRNFLTLFVFIYIISLFFESEKN